MQTGAVGSSWMQDRLNRHPNISCIGEHPLQAFSVGRIHSAYRTEVRSPATLPQGRRTRTRPLVPGPTSQSKGLRAKKPQKRAWGFKVKLDVLTGRKPDAGPFYGADRLPDFLQMLRCVDIALVCLYRRNWVKHAVSIVRQYSTNRAAAGLTCCAAPI